MRFKTILRAGKIIRWHEFALSPAYCPVCDARRITARLYRNEIGIRCLTCRATAVTMSLVAVLRRLAPDLASRDVYELSARGPLVRFLENNCRQLTCSEYLDGVTPGEYRNGVQCQDVQRLTFADNSFDLCTSTEVFEHVPDDRAGFAEIRRVLRPDGLLLFTVPIFPATSTVERARLNDREEVELLLPAEYHGDPVRGHEPILVFRDYGVDIVKRIAGQGFTDVRLLKPLTQIPFGYARRIVAARAPAA